MASLQRLFGRSSFKIFTNLANPKPQILSVLPDSFKNTDLAWSPFVNNSRINLGFLQEEKIPSQQSSVPIFPIFPPVPVLNASMLENDVDRLKVAVNESSSEDGTFWADSVKKKRKRKMNKHKYKKLMKRLRHKR